MHINRVTVHGFKSYNDTVVFGPFAPGKNALVGLNGSGKSNFYAAIGFVLLDEYAHIRIADRKALLHEGQGQSAMTAYVEIVFDNKSHNIPIDNDEVSIRRSIGLKKDEYFIDRKNSTRQDVHNLLESCGFSPSSGYYIVRQGKVNSLALMKDSDRLDLLYDIAGTKFYDQQREESLKMIQESNSRTDKINDSLNYIKERISQLEQEKEELEEYEKLDKERRAVEHLIQNIELSRINDSIKEKEESHRIESEAATNIQKEYDEIHNSLTENQSNLEDLKTEITHLTNEKEKYEKRKDERIRDKTRTDCKVKNLLSKLENTQSLTEKYSKELSKIESEIKSKEAQLKTVNTKFAEVSEKKGKAQGQLDALSQIVNNKIQDSKSTEEELQTAENTINRLVRQEKSEKDEIEELQDRLNKLTSSKAELDERISNQYAEEVSKKEEYNRLMNEKKELWQYEDQYLRETKKNAQKLDKLQAKINSAIPTDYSTGIEAINKMKEDIEGIYGPVYDLISCPDELSAAVSAAGRINLYSIVVENDKVAVKVIDQLTKKKSGMATTLSLNIADKNQYEFPKGVVSLASQLEFDEKFTNAINIVFGKTILANSLEEASSLVQQHKNLNVVTRDGEYFSANGPITGGSKQHNRSPIYLQTLIKKLNERQEDITNKLKETKDNLSRVEDQINAIRDDLTNSKAEREKNKDQRINITLNISDIQDEIEGKKTQIEKLTTRIEEAKRNYLSIEKRLNYIKEFNSQVDDGTYKQLSDCRHENDELTKAHSKLYREKIELSSQIKDSLIPRQKRLLEELDSLNSEKLTKQLEVLQKENDIANRNFEEISNQIQTIDSRLTDAINSASTIETEVLKLQKKEDRSQSKLSSRKNEMEKILSQIALLKQRQEECIKQDKEIGALPGTEIQQFEGQSRTELMRHLTDINQEAQRFMRVNKKAIEQYNAFTQQEKELTERQRELQESNESINKLIETLDQRKEVAIARTFAEISDNFTQILRELEPNATGRLVLQRDEETNKYIGVTIQAQFEEQEVVSLAQLSGGQRALIALTLIFSIQKYAPAPFYLFDEVDSALDDKYRLAVSNLMNKFCHPANNGEPAQIIFTTFKKELLDSCDKYFAVKYERDHSSSLEISQEEANKIISEQNENNDNY